MCQCGVTDAALFVSVCHERTIVTNIGVHVSRDLCHVTESYGLLQFGSYVRSFGHNVYQI